MVHPTHIEMKPDAQEEAYALDRKIPLFGRIVAVVVYLTCACHVRSLD